MDVLIVDDEHRLAAALARGLQAEGFTVQVAHDGVHGQDLALQHHFDVIVLDIMLPGRNGYEVCANLRSEGVDTPILMLTAKDGEMDEVEALDTGADDYLAKPFHFVVLVARLKALLRRRWSTNDSVVKVGELEVFPSQHRCVYRGQEVDLTAKEFAILVHLATHFPQVVAKSELIDQVWDFAQSPDANVVEVHISALRRKLGPGLIETVRGVGYRIVAGS
ncbi:MAG TPA: response regulator transcription factor [Beutenbergiaceae bacterium]|nr:response regulator transcription factor [Beutenbergiaceae bacterium]